VRILEASGSSASGGTNMSGVNCEESEAIPYISLCDWSPVFSPGCTKTPNPTSAPNQTHGRPVGHQRQIILDLEISAV
jgi:hypothetical protein